MRTRVKICGITRVEDAQVAANLGVDAIGLVFYENSPRVVTPRQAAEIVKSLPAFVTAVGLFLDADSAMVRDVLDQVPLDELQFHGDETAQACRQYARPYFKAVPMASGMQAACSYMSAYPDARAFLLDSHGHGQAGGSGERFDWLQVTSDRQKPFILAGGITPGNVAEAIRTTRPYAVDVSSGVESAKGIKDPVKMAAFMQEVRDVDCNET